MNSERDYLITQITQIIQKITYTLEDHAKHVFSCGTALNFSELKVEHII